MSRKELTCLVGCEITNMRQIFKAEVFIYQSKANLDEKILFGKIAHHLGPEIRKMQVNSRFGNQDSTFHLVHHLLAIEIKVLFMKLTM